MQPNARKSRAKTADLVGDSREVVDEQGRVAGFGDERIRPAAAEDQDMIFRPISLRNRAHRLGHAVSSLLINSRSSLPLGLRGSSSRQSICDGCIKFGNSRRRWLRKSASFSWPAPLTTRAMASPS